MFNTILYEERGGVAWITLNRPQKRNALTLETQAELSEALWHADNKTSLHCAVIKGAGGDFCAGYDLSGQSSKADTSRIPVDRADTRKYSSVDDDIWQLERAQRHRMAIFDIHKPVIAQVHGNCLAGGTDIALLCDMIICAEDAVFGFPAARDLGSLPTQMWLYLVGPQWAKRLLLTGDSITGQEAAQIGLVLKAVPKDALDDEVEGLAARLALIDPDILAANKRVVNLGLELMGARTMQRLAAENDARGHQAASARAFMKSVAENGLKTALQARDAPFGDGRARVNGPERRDENGHLIDP